MMNCKQRLSVFFLLVIAFSPFSKGIAAQDPIRWSLDHPFASEVFTGTLHKITYTLTNTLPSQLVHPMVIAKNASPASEFTYVDNCTGHHLLHDESCTVEVELRALVVGTKYIQISIEGYDNNVVPLPQETTTAIASSTSGVVGTPTQPIPSSMYANTSASYTFTFTNNSDTDATGLAATVTQTTGTVVLTNNACKPSVTPVLTKLGGTCTVSGTFTPTSNTPASQSVNVSLVYSGPTGSPATTLTSTMITQAVPGGPIVGSVASGAGLPAIMVPGQVTTGVEFLFTNTSTGSYNLTGSPTVALTYSTDNFSTPGTTCNALSTPSCTSIANQCINSLSQSPAACSYTFTFTAPSTAATSPPTTYSVRGTLAYNSGDSPATATTSGAVVSAIPTTRTLKFVNNCGFKVAYSLNGASERCVPGVTVEKGTTGACFWQNYHGTTVNNVLTASGGTDYVTIPANNIDGIQWSGNISAMVDCDVNGENCQEAQCGNGGTGNCAIGIGFNQPATQAEITMLVNSVDSYDAEVINGFHIPVSMQPYAYLSSTTPADDIASTPSNYFCGTSGSYPAGNGFSSCNWDLATVPTTPSSAYYYFVGGGRVRAVPVVLAPREKFAGSRKTSPIVRLQGHYVGILRGIGRQMNCVFNRHFCPRRSVRPYNARHRYPSLIT